MRLKGKRKSRGDGQKASRKEGKIEKKTEIKKEGRKKGKKERHNYGSEGVGKNMNYGTKQNITFVWKYRMIK